MKDWDQLGKQFWNAWTDAAQQAAPAAATPHPGFDLWAKLFSDPAQPNEVVERMVGSAKHFAELMQSAIGQLASKNQADPIDFTAAVRNAMGGMNMAQNPMLDAMRAASSEGSRGFEQMFAEFSKSAAPMREQALGMLSLPAFGYTRERQEKAQKFAQGLVAYNEAMNAYNQQMLKASQRGLEILEYKLAERSEPGRELTSLRAFYDVYIDAAEEGFAEVALSPDYRRVYGDLVNAQMRVRQSVQAEVEHQSRELGMPTRTELSATHKKMADLRRRMARMEELLERHGLLDADDAASDDEAPVAEVPRAARPKAAARPVAAKAPAKAPAAAPRAAKAAAASGSEKSVAQKALTGVADFAARLAAARSQTGKSKTSKPRKGGK
jgi:class III poly(R)-hydroxyalkanoic acid synthase PhaE subunit